MKKFLTIIMALTIAFFTLPFSGNTVLADGKSFDDIEDGEHGVSVKALEEDSDDNSAADGFLMDEATLSVDGDDITLVFNYTKDFPQDYGINWTKLEGNNPIAEHEDDNAFSYTFKIDEIKETYQASMNYYVPGMPGDMGDKEKGHSVDYRIILDGSDLDGLPVKSEEEGSDHENTDDKDKPETAPENREVGKLLTEKEADAVYELEYGTDSKATAGNLKNPVKLLEKGNKKYIQIPINKDGAQYFRSLKIDGKEVTWNSITEGPYTIQFELNNGIEDELDLSMVIQAGPMGAMPHKGIKLWFDEDSLEVIKEPTPEKDESDGDNDSDKTSEGIDVGEKSKDVDYVILHENGKEKSTANSFFQKPGKLFEKDGKQYVQVTINNGNMIKNLSTEHGDATIVNKNKDGSIDVQFRVNDDLSDTLLKMNISVPGMYEETHKAIFSFIEGNPEHKSKDDESGQSGEPGESENPVGEANQEVEKAYKIDYTINHKNGEKKSLADQFFLKPGLLLEKDGKTYAQLTINNGDMIKQLSSEYGDAVIIEKNDDGSITVQFRVHSDLSDTLLKMHIHVPGMYNEEHEAILVFDKDSKEEVDASNFKIAKELLNVDKTPKKPKFGDNDDNNGTPGSNVEKAQNPKTGDTSSILLYSLLLLGSALPLIVKVRRRFN